MPRRRGIRIAGGFYRKTPSLSQRSSDIEHHVGAATSSLFLNRHITAGAPPAQNDAQRQSSETFFFMECCAKPITSY